MLAPRSASKTAAVLVSAVLATAAVVLAAAPASAHNRLISSDPAQSASLSRPPESIALVFDDDLLPVGTAVQVTGPAGPVEVAEPTVQGDRVVQALPTGLPAGGYSVLWRVTSADGHPIDGTLEFTAEGSGVDPETVRTATPTETATTTAAATTGTATAPPEGEPDADGGLDVLPWAMLGGVLVAAGAWLATRYRGKH